MEERMAVRPFVKTILVIYVLKNTGKLVVNTGKTQGIQSKPECGHPDKLNTGFVPIMAPPPPPPFFGL